MAGEFGNSMFFDAAAMPGMFSPFIEPNFQPFGSDLFGDNPMAGLMVGMGTQWLFGGQGFLPGQLMPNQNMYDQLRARQYQLARLDASRAGFQHDEAKTVQLMRGFAQMTGVSFGMDQLRAAGNIASGLSDIMPFIAPMAPLTFDAMFGGEGSQGIAADVLFRRGQHEVDPVTGLMGLSAETAGQRAGHIFDRLYRQGAPGQGLAEMRGLGMGAAATELVEMERRGMAGPSIGAMGAGDQATALQEIMKEIGQNTSLDDAKRQFDDNRAADNIKKMAGALSAIRDLFGEQGRADAPMQQLFQAMSSLTAGGLSMSQPDELERTVRQTQSALRMGGMSLDSYSSLLARGAHVAQTMGLDPATAPEFTLGAVFSGIAYGQTRGMSTPAWGRVDREKFTLEDQQLRAAAQASGSANNLSALIRYEETVGGLGGRALDIVNAARAEKNTWGPGGTPGRLRPGEALGLLQQYAGADAAGFLEARDANAPYGQKYHVGALVHRTEQAIEVRELASMAYFGALQAHGMSQEDARNMSIKMGQALVNMPADISAIDTERDKYLNKILGPRADATLINESAWNYFDRYSRSRLHRPAQEAMQMFNPANRERAAVLAREARYDSDMATALSPLNRQGTLTQLSDLIRGPAPNLMEGIARMAGGVSVDDLANAVSNAATGTRDAAGNIGEKSAQTRLAVVSQAMSATREEFKSAQARGAPEGEIGALVQETSALVTGGDAADKAYAKLRTEVMLAYDLTDAHFEQVLQGASPGTIPQGLRQRLVGLAAAARGKVGVSGLMEKAGINTRARIGGEDMNTVAHKADRFSAIYDRVARGIDTPGEKRQAAGFATTAVAEAKRLSGIALADETNESLAAFGEGSVQKVEQLDTLSREIEALASAAGMSVGDLSTYTGTTGEQAGFAKMAKDKIEKIKELSSALANMHGKVGGKGKISEDDKKEAERVRREAAGGRRKQDEKLLEDTLKATGGHMSPEDKKATLEQMGKLKDEDALQTALHMAISELGGDMGASPEGQARRKMVGGLAEIGDSNLPGKLGTDSSATRHGIESKLNDIKDKESKAEADKRTLTITFAHGSVLPIQDNKVDFSNVWGSGTTSPEVGV